MAKAEKGEHKGKMTRLDKINGAIIGLQTFSDDIDKLIKETKSSSAPMSLGRIKKWVHYWITTYKDVKIKELEKCQKKK